MRITRLELQDFRGYRKWEIEPDSALTVFTGPNAVGKTNVIEAIQVVATGASFRNPQWDEVIRWGARSAAIRMITEGDGSHAEVELRIERGARRTWVVGGAPKRRATDACRFVPTVVFTPDDLAIVKGPAEQRRSALDALGEQLSATYGALRRDYARVVRQRNTLLRSAAPAADLAPWDGQLVRLGGRLHSHRRRLARKVVEAASPMYAHLAAGEVLDAKMFDRCGLDEHDLTVEPVAEEVEQALRAELDRRRDDERARGVSLAGPHRDDIVFDVDGRDARTFASQGQQRTIALAWKCAEVAVMTGVLKKTPVLLLDDVMSELDEARRGSLTDLVQRDVQTFITTTNTGYFDRGLLKRARVVTLGGGA
ncbi:MAG: DNA replication/repair protein RecF, partial [Actinobacteria bacterium]|nr:DNA replication/repair protein RecF [Actinomycetota bacterium]